MKEVHMNIVTILMVLTLLVALIAAPYITNRGTD